MRWDKKVYRRQCGKLMEQIFENTHCENWFGFFCYYILLAQRCWWCSKLYRSDIWREDIVVPYVTTYAVPLRTRAYAYTIEQIIFAKMFIGDIFDSIFYRYNVVGGGVQMYKRHIWRHPSRAQKRNHRFLFRTVGHRKDIVVPYVVTYAIPLRTRAHAYTIM